MPENTVFLGTFRLFQNLTYYTNRFFTLKICYRCFIHVRLSARNLVRSRPLVHWLRAFNHARTPAVRSSIQEIPPPLLWRDSRRELSQSKRGGLCPVPTHNSHNHELHRSSSALHARRMAPESGS